MQAVFAIGEPTDSHKKWMINCQWAQSCIINGKATATGKEVGIDLLVAIPAYETDLT